MNKKTKYYLVIRCIVISIILIILLSTLNKLLVLYRDILPLLFDTIITLFKVFNTISIIVLVLASIYLVYQIYLYTQSKFYKDKSINFFEAIYHGFMDIYLVYDKIYMMTNISNLQVDLKNRIVSFERDNKHYCILFVELFGKINNKMDNEMWAILSKPKKEFGRKRYTKKLKFPNPVRQVNEYVEKLPEKEQKKVYGFVVLNGYFNTAETSNQILAPHELSSILDE